MAESYLFDDIRDAKQLARDEVAALFEPLARELQDIANELARVRRDLEG